MRDYRELSKETEKLYSSLYDIFKQNNRLDLLKRLLNLDSEPQPYSYYKEDWNKELPMIQRHDLMEDLVAIWQEIKGAENELWPASG